MRSVQLCDFALVGQADRQLAQRAERLDLGARASSFGSGDGRSMRRSLPGAGDGSWPWGFLRFWVGGPLSLAPRGHHRSRRADCIATASRPALSAQGAPPRIARGAPAPRAGRSGRTRAGSGCPGARRSSPGASRTPSASTSPAAQSSIRTPGTVSRGNPIDPPRGRTHVNRSAQSSKNSSSGSRFDRHDPARAARGRDRGHAAR